MIFIAAFFLMRKWPLKILFGLLFVADIVFILALEFRWI